MQRTVASEDETLTDAVGNRVVHQRPGASVGRYLILEEIGAGAMGVVYAAYDPELGRKIALKLVHSTRGGPAGEARLLREAQALARVAHPNVVSVHDVGSVDGQVFVAMEFVQGETLTRWLAGRRPWRTVLTALLDAGRGLAAVHAVGLVHRDFKPDNVMIDGAGRVRVMDFGLARGDTGDSAAALQASGLRDTARSDDAPPSTDEPVALAATGLLAITGQSGDSSRSLARVSAVRPLASSAASLDLRLTATGAVLGTPVYMAPELHRGGVADARSDQFSFCVALYEGLYGQRPFQAGNLLALAMAMASGRARPVPLGSRVPAWVHRALLRGLRPQPDERWPTMDALRVALERDPGRARRRAAIAGLAALGLGLGLFVATRDDGACSDAGAHIAAVWDARRQTVAEAFAATGRVDADLASQHLATRLDEYAAHWTAMHTTACLAHRRGEQSSALLDLQMTCLEGQKRELAAIVDGLADADAAIVDRAAEIGESLPDLSRCADLRALRAGVDPADDPATVVAVDEVRARLARARADETLGRYRSSLELARAALVAARTLDYAPLIAEAELVVGVLASRVGDVHGARSHAENAYFTAVAARHEPVALDAALELVHVVGDRLHHRGEADTWARQAEALLAHAGPDDPAWRLLSNVRGIIHHNAGELEQAERAYRQTLAQAEAAGRRLSAASAHNNLGGLLHDQGRYAAARIELDAAVAIHEQEYGPDHPLLIEPLLNLAMVALAERDLDDAARHATRARAIAERAFGSDSPRLVQPLRLLGDIHLARDQQAAAAALYEQVLARMDIDVDSPERAVVHSNLGNARTQLGQYDQAKLHLDAALAQRLRLHGPDDASVASSLANLGELSRATGDLPRAAESLTRALALQERSLGGDHPDLGYTLVNLAEIERELHRDDVAEVHLRRALTLWRRTLGETHPLTVHPLLGLIRISLAHDRHSDAVTLAEQALTMLEPDDKATRAETEFLLAQALWPRDRPRALGLARAAAPILRETDPELATKLATWLAAHD